MPGKAKFDFLIKQHKNRIYSYSIYMIRNIMDAEDITQEVLIKTWQNIDNFNFLSAKAWMMRTTHNLCIDYLRRNKKIYKHEMQVDESFEEVLLDESFEIDPVITAERISIKENLNAAIERLPERLKSPFVLYEIQGFKYKEIGDILDIPLNTVKVNIMRARKELQKLLKEYAKNY
jgi:RNA polymerase sigma-70 factor (ECF subfamily)